MSGPFGPYAETMPGLLSLLRSTHPAPTAAVTAIAVLLGAGIGLPAERVLLVGAVVLLNQFSIGLSNDAIDAGRDRAANRADKPVARGQLTPRNVMVVAVACGALSLALAGIGGVGMLLADAVLLTAGWLYNAGLKATAASVVTYLVGFAALPAIPTLAAPTPVAPVLWAVAAASLLGGAAHFANVLPDLEDDAEAGVRGLPQRLGRTRATAVTVVLVLAAATVIVAGAGVSAPLLVGLALVVVLAAGVVVSARRDRSRLPFLLVMVAALVAVVMLLLAGGRVAG